MGLDIWTKSYGFRAGSYSFFNTFREWLAEKEGVHFENDYPYNGSKLKMLLAHSDCDGYITPFQAKTLLKGLISVKNKLKNEPLPPKTQKDYLNEIYCRNELDQWIGACQSSIDTQSKIGFG